VNGVVAFVVFLPLVVVWCLALYDVMTRNDITHRRRLVLAVVLVVFVPFTILYLLARPPSAVRRGSEDIGDPRTALVDQLEAPVDQLDHTDARGLAGRVREALPTPDAST